MHLSCRVRAHTHMNATLYAFNCLVTYRARLYRVRAEQKPLQLTPEFIVVCATLRLSAAVAHLTAVLFVV